MFRIILKLVLFVVGSFLYSQELRVIKPKIGERFDFEKRKKEFEKLKQILKALESGEKKWEDLSEEEEEIYWSYGEVYDDMWQVLGYGCSFYCSAGGYSVKASSFLPPIGNNDYKPENLIDFSYKTAWVEGVKGYGIGETIEFSFPPTHPRITTVIIVNGYVKSYKTWKDNSRVKKLKMYVNNKPYAILELQDVYATQTFFLNDTLGYSERDNIEKLKQKPNWTIKFEILDVYKGDKYDDTAITEIYFDGIDVH